MQMSRLLKTLLLIAVLVINGGSQGFDTLYTRGRGYILVEKTDTVSQLARAEEKADTILKDLEIIKIALNIKDTIK